MDSLKISQYFFSRETFNFIDLQLCFACILHIYGDEIIPHDRLYPYAKYQSDVDSYVVFK